MPVTFSCRECDISETQVAALWKAVITTQAFPDEVVQVRSVTEAEIQELNAEYRGKDAPTNVLTFSYPAEALFGSEAPEHDVLVCMAVAKREAGERSIAATDYVALLLVHAFLHVTGMDHERSTAEAERTRALEKEILQQAGFRSAFL